MKRARKSLSKIREIEYDRAYRDSITSLINVMEEAEASALEGVAVLEARIIVKEVFGSIRAFMEARLKQALVEGDAPDDLIVAVFDQVRETSPNLALDKVIKVVSRRCGVEVGQVMDAICKLETGNVKGEGNGFI